MTRYKEYVQKMLDQNREAFDSFRNLHDQYSIDQYTWQEKFNEEGRKIMLIIGEYENRLCSKSQGAGFSQFTPKLAEKFRTEIRLIFPLIDHIGITPQPSFSIKKISLS